MASILVIHLRPLYSDITSIGLCLVNYKVFIIFYLFVILSSDSGHSSLYLFVC